MRGLNFDNQGTERDFSDIPAEPLCTGITTPVARRDANCWQHRKECEKLCASALSYTKLLNGKMTCCESTGKCDLGSVFPVPRLRVTTLGRLWRHSHSASTCHANQTWEDVWSFHLNGRPENPQPCPKNPWGTRFLGLFRAWTTWVKK